MHQEFFSEVEDVDAYACLGFYDIVMKQDRSCRKIAR